MDSRPGTLVIAILGIDGSGKSTLSRHLAQEFSARGKAALIGDQAEVLDHGRSIDLESQLTERLRRRVGARAKNASSLAAYKIPKLAELVLRDRLLGEILAEYSPRTTFMDGMPLFNLTAWSILYRRDQFSAEHCATILETLTAADAGIAIDDEIAKNVPELVRLVELGYNHFHVPDVCLFLDASPERCLERIQARGKARQVHETSAALGQLRAAYAEVCKAAKARWRIRMHTLDGDRDLAGIVKDASSCVDEAWRASHAG